MTTKPILYYGLFSPPARACMLTAKIIGLDLDLRVIDFAKKEHLTEEFIKLNPQHTIPVFVDGDEVLWDSHAIMTYMVSKFAQTDILYPNDLLTRARIDQRMYYENGVLFPVIKDIVFRIIYGDETEYAAETIENCHIAYGFLEKFLDNHEFVVGNIMTVADLSIHTTLITLNRSIPVDKFTYPNIINWLERMKNQQLPGNEEINEIGAAQAFTKISLFLEANRKKAGLI